MAASTFSGRAWCWWSTSPAARTWTARRRRRATTFPASRTGSCRATSSSPISRASGCMIWKPARMSSSRWPICRGASGCSASSAATRRATMRRSARWTARRRRRSGRCMTCWRMTASPAATSMCGWCARCSACSPTARGYGSRASSARWSSSARRRMAPTSAPGSPGCIACWRRPRIGGRRLADATSIGCTAFLPGTKNPSSLLRRPLLRHSPRKTAGRKAGRGALLADQVRAGMQGRGWRVRSISPTSAVAFTPPGPAPRAAARSPPLGGPAARGGARSRSAPG